MAAELLQPPVNALRLSLHPQGLAPRIANLAEWRGHLLYRLRRQVELTADAALIELLREVSGYPGGSHPPPQTSLPEHEIAVPFRIKIADDILSFFSLTTLFGSHIEVALSELALELFFPADDATDAAVRRMTANIARAN